MKKILAFLIITIFTVCFYSSAQANVITFDNITSGITDVYVPIGYAGFNWSAHIMVLPDVRYSVIWGNSYDSHSGDYAIFNEWGNPEITFGELIDFSGTYFSGWGLNNNPATDGTTATSVTVLGYQWESFIDSISMNLATNQYDWLSANLLGIERVVIQSTNDRNWWLMDNFTYDLVLNGDITTETNGATAPMPESAILLLLGTGLMGIAGIRKKFKKS